MLKLVPWRWREKDVPPIIGAFRGKVDYLFQRFTSERQCRSLARNAFYPVIDVSETDKEIVVKAEVPGIDLKDLDISLDGNTLTISGEKKDDREEMGEQFHRVERSFGSFSVSIALPCEVQEGKIESEQKIGVLLLKILKAEPEETVKDRLEVPGREREAYQLRQDMG